MNPDVLIVGGSYAGIAAGLILARARRPVTVIDAGSPRNRFASHSHGVLGLDGISGAELLKTARQQLLDYPSVRWVHAEAVQATASADGVEVRTADGQVLAARKLLLASGITDQLPELPGLAERWGSTVLHCPYCHGYEVRDQPLAVYGRGKAAVGLALLLTNWSRDLVVVTDGPGHLSDYGRQRLRQHKIGLRQEPVKGLVGGPNGMLRCVEFEDGTYLERTALFLHAPQEQRSALAADTGALITSKGAVWIDKNSQTSIPGLYAAGDTTPGQQQALIAAGEGSKVAICLNEALTKEQCA